MVLILTESVSRYFEKNPKFDMTPLLGGTDVVFSSLFHSFRLVRFILFYFQNYNNVSIPSNYKTKNYAFHCCFFFRNPASFLHAYTYLPLPCATRQAVAAILQDVSDSSVIYSMLMSKYNVFFFLPHKWISFMYFIFFKCRL